MSRLIRLVVVDLDNTLYDWVGAFIPALDAMVQAASQALGVPEGRLLDDLRAVHIRHRDCEHPCALLETRSVSRRLASLDADARARHLEPALSVFEREQGQRLALYPGVAEALDHLRSHGTAIAAHTDATTVNALGRVRRLGLDRSIARVYARRPWHAPIDTRGPSGVDSLARHEKKPDPRVLHKICRAHGTAPEHTLYVGDSMARDIGMARAAGARSAWAKYGTGVGADLRARLDRVSHWTARDLAREAAARKSPPTPDAVLRSSLGEIFDHFEFAPNLHAAPR